MNTMNNEQFTRYAKQMKVYHIGREGQQKLSAASCAIIGAGALGAAIAEQLVRAGIGYLRIIDRDFVELSNLHRQTLYTEQDAQQFMPKAIAASKALKQINSTIVIDGVIADVNSGNIRNLLDDVDIIVDGSDNFTIRYLLNDYCVAHNKTWVYGAVTGTSGVTTTFTPHQTPCFRCLFPEPPELGALDTCDTVGVLGPVVTMIAAIQAMEVIKFASGHTDQLNRQLIQLDCWSLQMYKLDIAQARSEQCPCCVGGQFHWMSQSETTSASSLCGRESIQLTLAAPLPYSLEELAQLYSASYIIKRNRYLLKLSYSEQITVIFFPDSRLMIQGTEDLQYAAAIVNKLIQI